MDPQNATYLFYGFAAAWLLMIGYVVMLTLRESRLRRELDRVRRMVEKK
jgi:CcmD family protein